MKTHLKTLEGCIRLMQVQVEPPQVSERRSSLCEEFARAAHLPGFRPGKAPREMVVRHFSGKIEEELLRRLIEESCEAAIRELKLPVVEVQEIQEVSFKEDRLSYKARVEVRPQVTLRRYKGIKATRPKAQAKPEEVQKVLRSLQEQHAQLIPKEGVVAEGDFVVCDLKRRLGTKEIEGRKNFLMSVAQEGESSAKVAQALVGAKPGQTRQVTLEELFCEFTIHEIKTKQVPPLDDAFAKQVGNFSTLEELEEQIRKGILQDKEKRLRQDLERQILDELLKECTFALPKSLLEREIRREEETLRLRCQFLGMKPEETEAAFQKEKTQCETRAQRNLRQAFLLDRVASLEKINATVEEVEDRLRELSKETGDPASLRGRAAEQIRLEKATAFLVAHAQVQEE